MATIALDIGGTKIASAIFFPDGSMMFNRKRLLKGRTGHEVGKLAADILAKLLTVARRSRIHIDGIGVCIPGIVYSQTNRVWAPNIPGWDNYPLYEELRSVTPPGIEIYIDSDRTCYMYGEMWQGAAKECHSAIFIAVGTGIGAGIIIDGHVLHGANDIIGATGWMYFAILAVNPAPCCILDEIEAALDDANVSRFAQYLRRVSDKTQFIVITHRRGTMEAANVLYGVTMQEDGVSKLLKLDLEQVDATLVS